MAVISGEHRAAPGEQGDHSQIPQAASAGAHRLSGRRSRTPERALVQENVFRFNFIGHRPLTAFDDLTSEVQNRRAPFACRWLSLEFRKPSLIPGACRRSRPANTIITITKARIKMVTWSLMFTRSRASLVAARFRGLRWSNCSTKSVPNKSQRAKDESR